jgi:predicted  nucleic acid-binding Zn-ribbon protein
MKEIIARLKELNKLDLRLQTLQKDLERLPKELTERQLRLKTLHGVIDRAKTEVVRLKSEADGVELEVKSGEEALRRYASQLNILRSSKEFETSKRQMDAQRIWNKENETKELELLEKADAKQKEIDANLAAQAKAEQELQAETDRVDKESAELHAEYDKLHKEREMLAKDVPEKDLTLYNRIAIGRGQAIATVEAGGICSACCMRIPPQVHNLALIGKELAFCPSCGRILTGS